MEPNATGVHQALANRHIEAVVIGASAGGVEALLGLLPVLPADYAAAVIVVLHLPQDHDSALAEVFRRRLRVPACEALDKQRVAAGTVYFAAAGYHLLVEADRTFSLSCEAPVQYSRPSIDVLMDSAAQVYGAGLAAILLTGANSDGAEGLAAVKESGGLTVVQDPVGAAVRTMPAAAIERQAPDLVLSLPDIRKLLQELNR
ncbi:MAG: chemotaxis protein CheB [Pseudomonadota bacterium]|nr:chemotaxis protein CheB [Pseudomonadota bacterium]